MTSTVVWHTLGPIALAIIVGYLFGRWQRRRRLDRVELAAWHAGFRTATSCIRAQYDLYQTSHRLDTAEGQTGPPPAPWWN